MVRGTRIRKFSRTHLSHATRSTWKVRSLEKEPTSSRAGAAGREGRRLQYIRVYRDETAYGSFVNEHKCRQLMSYKPIKTLSSNPS